MTRGQGAYLFFALACAITWSLDVPIALAIARDVQPSPLAMLLGGLGAWGPTLAALILAAPRGELREVFGRWRTRPIWWLVALATVPALHLVANLVEVALGGRPAQWFYPPVAPEHVAALIMFSVGEEFGWRGFAYPRLAERHGPVLAASLVGMVWAVWHVLMWVTPEGLPSARTMAIGIAEFTAASIVIAWVFERSDRSMAVAILLHAGAHLDNVARAPEEELRLRVLRFAVVAIAAVFAARSLARRAPTAPAGRPLDSRTRASDDPRP